MGTAFEVASSIRKWAISKNLLDTLPDAIERMATASVNAAIITEESEEIFRKKGVLSITYNDKENNLIVYTKKVLTKKESKNLPQEIDGCTIYYTHGTVPPLGVPPHQAQGSPTNTITLPSGSQHYCCGSSISPGNSAGAGTLGALVRDQAGNIFGLSNNHVTGACSHSLPFLPVVAPGILDVSPNNLHPFTLGVHVKALEMVPGVQGNVDIFQNTDAAIFKILNIALVSSMQGNKYDTPTVVSDPEVGMYVEKFGRTTGHTKGFIIGKELVPLQISVQAPQYGFSANIWFSNVLVVHGDNEIFSEPGDSGSLIVTRSVDGTMSAVGLLFAGGQDARAYGQMKTLILPLRPILERFNVELVGGLNVLPTS